jgi:hypothetical protein
MNKDLVWKIALGCSGLGLLMYVFTWMSADSAPQEAAGAALSIAIAVIPYCFARAFAEINTDKDK